MYVLFAVNCFLLKLSLKPDVHVHLPKHIIYMMSWYRVFLSPILPFPIMSRICWHTNNGSFICLECSMEDLLTSCSRALVLPPVRGCYPANVSDAILHHMWEAVTKQQWCNLTSHVRGCYQANLTSHVRGCYQANLTSHVRGCYQANLYQRPSRVPSALPLSSLSLMKQL